MTKKNTCYFVALAILMQFASITAISQSSYNGTASANAVVNFDQLEQYYTAHPTPSVRILQPEPEEEEGRPHHHRRVPPSQIHYRQNTPGNTYSNGRSAYLPASANPTDTFEAVLDNGNNIPPDTHGAADSNYVVTTTNSTLRIQTKANASVSSVLLDNFWTSVMPSTATFTFDPRVHYDPYANRWIIASLADNNNSTASSVLIGVSQTSNPHGNWNLFAVTVDSTQTYWLDFPNIGFNGKWIVFSGNLFPVSSSGSTNGARLYVFNKANLMNNTNGNHKVLNEPNSFTICPSLVYNKTEPNLFAVETWNPSSGQLQLWKITGAIGSEVITSVGFPATTAHWQASGPSNGADFAPQLGTTNKIQTNDDRITNLIFRNGKLWCSHNVFLPATGTVTRSSIQWWQIDTLANPLQIGRLDDPTAANFYGFPGLAVNKNDDALIGFTHFSSTIHPSAAYAIHMHTDPIDSLRPYHTYRHGATSYYKVFTGTKNRWGDYSASAVDPVNDVDFWTVQEASATTVNTWDTWWAHVVISYCTGPAAPTSVTMPSSTPCQGDTATYTVPPVAGATSYTWVATGTGWSGSSTTNSITYTTGSTAASITVYANDSCGPGSPYTFNAPVGNCCISTSLPLKQGFETNPFPGTGFAIGNPNSDTTWVRVTSASGFGQSTACAYLACYNNSLHNTRDYIYTPTYNFTHGIGAGSKLKFDYAYAPYSGNNDSLQVLYSTNCGSTWTSLWVKGGANLGTATSSVFFVPNSTQWKRDSSISLASLAGQTDVQFAFVGINQFGNNIYLDNINIDTIIPTCTTPPAPASVTRPTTHCTGTAANYTAAAVTGATSYTWTVSGTGWSGTSTTNTISLTAGSGPGTITVKANNTCGAGAVYSFFDTPSAAPATPANMTLPTAPCPNATAVYTIPSVSGAASYTWSVGGTGWSGTSSTNSITLTAGSAAGSVSVTANNTCGLSSAYTFAAPVGTAPTAPANVSLPTAPCPNATAVYIIPAVSGATSYTWSVSGTGWSGTSSTNSITLTAGAAAGSVSVTANNACGSSSAYTFSAPVGAAPATPTNATLPANAPCPNATAVYTIPAVSGATSYTWSVGGTGWSGSGSTTTATLTAGTVAGSVSVTANNTCGSSSAYAFSAPIGAAPATPANVTLPSTPCPNATAIYAIPAVSGATSYTWSINGTGWSGSSTTDSITLTAGTGNASISVTANNACGSSSTYGFTATSQALLPSPFAVYPRVAAPCPNTTNVYVATPVIGATSYTWSVSGAGWSGSSTVDSITLVVGSGTANVTVTANNSCGAGSPYIFNAPNSPLPAVPSNVTMPTAPCPNATAIYSIPAVSGATSYTWTVSGTGWSGTSSTTTCTLTAGSVAGSVSVTANNACGPSTAYTFTAPIASVPATPGSVTLPTAPCPNATATYTIPVVSGATSYTWSVSGTGWSGTSSTNSITLTAGAVAGSVSVTADNVCGSSSAYTFSAPIGAAPAAPASVTLPTVPCPTATAIYTVPAVSGATSYTWSVSGTGWSGSSSTNSITLTAGAVAGSVSVTANNACGSSSAFVFNAPIGSAPSTAPLINNSNAPCATSSTTYTCNTVTGATSYVWHVSGTGWSGSSSTTSLPVTVGTGIGTIICQGQNTCGTGPADTIVVTPSPLPAAASTITAPSLLCTGDTGTFTTPAISGATSYVWTVSGTGWSGSSSTNSILVNAGTGTGTLSVKGHNTCGNGPIYTLNNVTPTAVPTATFSISAHTTNLNIPVTVTYIGTAATGAVFTWNFGPTATATPGTGRGPHQLSWTALGTKTISLTVTVNGCSSTYTDTVNVTKPNGIADIDILALNINIVPNPNEGTFDITFDEAINKPFALKLTDAEGRLVYSKQFASTSGSKVSIISGGLPSGIYVATITLNGTSATRKVVINK